jgi:hypothetical protein
MMVCPPVTSLCMQIPILPCNFLERLFPLRFVSLTCIRFLDVEFAGCFRQLLRSAVVSVSVRKPFGDRILYFVFEISDIAQ